jgi:hypothetical protein
VKKVSWFIESFERDNSFEELAAEVRRQGMECRVVEYLPTGERHGAEFGGFAGDECVLFQGSIDMAIKIQRMEPWLPGPFVTWHNYLCSTYYCHYGKWLLNGQYTMMPFVEFWRRKQEFIDANDGNFFLRPNGGTKSFTGFAWASYSPNMMRFLESETPPEELVLLSRIHTIHREWRLICTKDKVLTGSRYKTWGRPDYNPEVPPEAVTLAETILKESDWIPDPIFVMDICDKPPGTYHLLEIGAFSVAGLYKCDMKPIVEVASQLAWEEFSLSGNMRAERDKGYPSSVADCLGNKKEKQ